MIDLTPARAKEESSKASEVDPSASILALRHPSHWFVGAGLAIVVYLLVKAIAENRRFQWNVVADYLFAKPILEGLAVTLQLTFISQIMAIVIGFCLAFLGQSKVPPIRWVVGAYIGVFRGLPLIVLLLVCFNAALFAPELRLSLFGWHLWHAHTNELIGATTAALIGLSLHEGAFMAEIIRGGVLSVDKGQLEAASSLGMKRGMAMRRVVYPQAVRVIIPPTGNQFISLLKSSSLVAVIGGGDLLTRGQRIYGESFAVVPILIVVSIWYLVLVSLATLGQHFIESKFALGDEHLAENPITNEPASGVTNV